MALTGAEPAGHEQQCGGRCPRGRAGWRGGVAVVARRACRDRRRGADPGHRAVAPARGSSRWKRRIAHRVADFEECLRRARRRFVLRVHPSNFTQSGFVESPDPAELAAAAPPAWRDRPRRSRLRGAARYRPLRPRATSRCRASGCKPARTSSRSPATAGGRAAGRDHRGPRRPRGAAPEGPAGSRDAPRQGDPQRSRSDATAVPRRRGAGEVRCGERLHARRGAGRASAAHGKGHGHAGNQMESTIGGGSLPGQTLPSWGVALDASSPQKVLARLRGGQAARDRAVVDDAVVLDLRTVDLGTTIARGGASEPPWRADPCRPSSSAPPGTSTTARRA